MKKPSFTEEKKIWKKGCKFVIGVDEVGKGAFAGPVVAAAVVFNKDTPCQPRTRSIHEDINDSKLLKPKKREELSRVIKKQAQLYAISTIGVSTINKLGVGKASQMAIRKSIKTVIGDIIEINNSKPPIFVLADGFHIKYIRGIGLINQKAIIKGDRKSISIAAASIIAKVYRDKLMRKLNRKYPGYGFVRNKGYGTKFHQIALAKQGLSEVHRTSFNLGKFLSF
ncbi:MAG: ribonuclease HII [Candidatus Levybacteria bacterium RIFCSPLOWO2_01_FULL_38_21]|nr:MAG: ribonuclease HII [Candidatus Levybacteria bacterium RIFCSPLOWO2_01_FULL_38_21]